MFRFLLPISYMYGVYLLSSIPGNSTNEPTSFVLSFIPASLQNLLHIPLYAGLSLSLLWSLKTPNKYIFCYLIAISFAISDELHQMLVPGRYGSIADILLDITGVLSAITYVKYKTPDPSTTTNK